MLFVILVPIVLGVGLIYKFRQRLAFRTGRLARSSDQLVRKSMGTDQFLELSFGRVHYIYRPSEGSSSSLNVFVHGFSIPMQIWENVFQSLVSDQHPCLIFDLYGRGYSDAPDVTMNVDLFVSQLAELLFALNLPYQNYHLYGVSMGGVIVQRFTELYPKKVSKLILCCSAGLNIVKPSKILMSILSIPILGPMMFKLVMQRGDNKSVRSQWAYPERKDYQEYVHLFQQACREHPGYLRSLFSTIASFDFESASQSIGVIQKLNIPILIIWGDKDSLIPVENAYRYHSFYGDKSTLTIIPGANHSLLIEHSSHAITAIKTFLREN